MKLFLLEPEVSGGHGNQTIYERNNDGSIKGVKYLHYVFDGWLGDELLESTPCFIITEEMNTRLKNMFSGDFTTESCLITKSEFFEESNPKKELPKFIRFVPKGTLQVNNGIYSNWTGHNFSLTQINELVVTSKALKTLKEFSINYCDIEELAEA